MAPDDTIWLTDDGDHTVRQCTLDGKVLLTIGIPGKPAPYMSGEPFHRCTHTAIVAERRDLRLRRLRQCARAQVLARRQAADVLGRAGHRSRRVQHRRTTSPATPTAGSMSPTARTTACRCSTATADTRRSGTTCTGPAACSCRRASARSATSASWGRCMPVNRNVPNLGPRVTHRRQHGQAPRPAGRPACRAWARPSSWRRTAWRWISHGDIYVGEVSWTNWPQTFPDQPRPDNLRSLHKFRKVS